MTSRHRDAASRLLGKPAGESISDRWWCSAQPHKRISEFANASKRQYMTIIDRLLRACATAVGCRALINRKALNGIVPLQWPSNGRAICGGF